MPGRGQGTLEYLALNVGDLVCLLKGRDIALKLLWG